MRRCSLPPLTALTPVDHLHNLVAPLERCQYSTAAWVLLLGAGDQPLQVLIDTIDALSEPLHEVVQRPPGRAEADRADVHAVALYLFAQLYIRQAQRADAMDVWPSSSPQAAAAAAAAVRPLCVTCHPPSTPDAMCAWKETSAYHYVA